MFTLLVYAIQLCICIVIGLPLMLSMTVLALAWIFARRAFEHMKRPPEGGLKSRASRLDQSSSI
jgi:hypothetical protein